jgi:putative flippase GtrA
MQLIHGAAAVEPEIRTPDSPVVDVVVPVFNEEAVLERSITRLHEYLSRSFPFTWRVTIVDNASTDGTARQAAELAAQLPNVRALHLDRKGRGLALRTAWTTSDAVVVAYMDVDLSTDLDALLPLVAPLVSGHSDVAIGSRLAPTASVVRAPKRELISQSYNLILRAVLATRIRDAQCGFKALRSDVARRLVPAVEDDGWFFDTELLLLAERNGLRIHEVPVDWVEDPDSRVEIVHTAMSDLRGTARMFGTFVRGRGRIDFGDATRRPGETAEPSRRLVSFTVIGLASTLVSLLLFLVLRGPLGPVAANAVAVSATFVANTWANARLTLRIERPRWRRSITIYLASLTLTSAALVAVDAAGGGLAAELLALACTWTAATIGRLVVLARPARPRTETDAIAPRDSEGTPA